MPRHYYRPFSPRSRRHSFRGIRIQRQHILAAMLSLFVCIKTGSALVDRLLHGYLYTNSPTASVATLAEINKIRAQYGRPPLLFDQRLFDLATARVQDMQTYHYYDHVNPQTGTCAYSMKAQFGFNASEYVAENALDYGDEGGVGATLFHPMPESISSWMSSRGHRYNLLYARHVAGAVACLNDKCVFLGLNHDRFGEGCHTAADGHQFWETTPLKPDEVQP